MKSSKSSPPRRSAVRAAINQAACQRKAGAHDPSRRTLRRTTKQALARGQWDAQSAGAF